MQSAIRWSAAGMLVGSALVACHGRAATTGDAGADAPADAPGARVTITSTVGSTRFATREDMLAGGEMQISGEPLAEAMGRDLTAYSRALVPPDIYFPIDMTEIFIDLPGFSTAIESYEYSKQPMNDVAFEAGAGTALVHAPLVGGNLAALIQHFAVGSNAAGKWVFGSEPLGWPGMWPTAHVFASFDPAIDPTSAIDLRCTITSDDDPADTGAALLSADYECSAATLHLRDRAAQIDPTITPGADGFSAWKYGLWTINYLQIMHDAANAPVASVAAADLASVGVAGNMVTGTSPAGGPAVRGTYLGSSDIEGFQAQMFLLELDSRADDWLARLTTSDGATLSGFASISAALAYDHAAPLRWFPVRIAVTETADPSGFPRPAYAIASADSDLLDLVGVAMGYAEVFALTDTRNGDVGGAQPARSLFDGDPFAADDQLADGEPTLHDRALAMIRVALVDADRLHVDPASGLYVDRVSMTGGVASRGHTLSTVSAAYTVIGLRTVLRSLDAQLELYSNNTTDTAVGRTPLDAQPLALPGDPAVTFTQRQVRLLRAHAELLLDHLTDASGRAWTGWDVAAGAHVDDADVLDAHTAAIRGLIAAYLATGDTRYRERAIAVFDRVEAVFYDRAARIFTATPAPADSVEYTPLRFALLQSALRDMYELVAARPGGEARVPVLEERIGRLNKLVLNGWDDRDRDRQVGWPDECTNVVDGLPRGGLQMAERTLTGEIGRFNDQGSGGGAPTSDREHDCVPEIDDAHLPAALAGSVTFWIHR